MTLVRVICHSCRKEYKIDLRRSNEAKKYKWKHYCSLSCQKTGKTTKIKIFCENPRCKKVIFRNIVNSTSNHYYCSQSCAAVINNSKFPKKIALKKYCMSCKKAISNRRNYCSPNCIPEKIYVGKKEIIAQIQQFYYENGRVPFKQEFIHCKASRNRFGTWNKAIKAAGFKPNPVKFAHKFKAKDGHKCDSLSEKIIDDWLFNRKIPHIRNAHYPDHKKYTADFKVKDYFIEFFGLHQELKTYDDYMKKKFDLINKHHLKLISIFPKDLFPNSNLEKIIGIFN